MFIGYHVANTSDDPGQYPRNQPHAGREHHTLRLTPLRDSKVAHSLIEQVSGPERDMSGFVWRARLSALGRRISRSSSVPHLTNRFRHLLGSALVLSTKQLRAMRLESLNQNGPYIWENSADSLILRAN